MANIVAYCHLSIDKIPRIDGKRERVEEREGLACCVRNDMAQIFNIFANTTSCITAAQQRACNQQQQKCFYGTCHHPCLK